MKRPSHTAQPTVFRWRGKDRAGRPASGEITGTEARFVRAALRRQGITASRVVKKRAAGGSLARLTSRIGNRINSAEIALFSRQLATMMRAGVPLVQALDIVGSSIRNPRFAPILLAIRADIAAGTTLQAALSKHPAQFDPLYRNLVQVGELSGTLDVMLARIATDRESGEAMRRKVKKAMIYPALVVTAALLITAILLVYVVPQFEVVFAAAGAELPAFTRFVIHLSDFVQAWWLALLSALGAVGAGFTILKRRSLPLRNALDALALKLPVIGGVCTNAATARCSRTLATAVAAGVPLVDALGAAADSCANAVYTAALRGIRDDVAAGHPLSKGLSNGGLFPSMMVQMVAVGEESGSLDDMLGRIAEQFEAQLGDAADHLAALMEPLMMIVLGTLVGGLVVAMYLPVFQLGNVFE